MTSMAGRIRLVSMMAAMTGMMAMAIAMTTAYGCAKRTNPAPPAAAAPDTRSDGDASASDASPSTSDSAASALSVDDQVRDALFRYLFMHDGRASRDWARVYFLAVMEGDKQRDPSGALMQRFAGHRPRVERASLADISFDRGAVHRYTREQGVVFTVGDLKRVSDDVVEAECAYYAGNLAASGGTYRVERKAGVWIVMPPKQVWVS